jgi:ABC-type multidrug transport system ATPase subunit
VTSSTGPALRIAGRTIDPGDSPLVVGRDETADVRVDSPLVSRRHATLEWADGAWRYVDAGSRNGTWRDGNRVGTVALAGEITLRLGAVDGPELTLAVDPQPARARLAGSARPPAADRAPGVATRLGQPSAIHEAVGRTLRIGREPGNDLVLDDLRVSRNHARVGMGPDGTLLEDLGSQNGTFVNGVRVERVRLADGDLVGIGGFTFRFQAGRLEEYTDRGGSWLAAVGLSVDIGGRRLLDEVSFALEPSSLMAVVGPSGAGKTTLLNALTGFRPADRGYVLFGGRDLYRAYGELRHRMGYVPQSDILHTQLSVRDALSYAAELRFPADVPAAARRGRVEEVIDELGLRERATTQIGMLSGGQRKRTSVAVELLTRPSLLFLDEPTSGLDPANEANLMELLHELARGGRTIVVVTHSVQSLDLCDRVLFLAPGGRLAFFGGPAETGPYFERRGVRPGMDHVFRALSGTDGTDWRSAYEADALHERHVRRPLSDAGPAGPSAAPVPQPPPPPTPWSRQLWVLLRRYLAVLRADRGVLALLAVQAPVFGVLYTMLFRGNVLSTLYAVEAAVLVWLLALGATWLGMSNAIREIVKELPVYRRERSIGLSVSAYVLSKVVVLGVITALQTIVMVAIAMAPQQLPPVHPPEYEQLLRIIPTDGPSLPSASFDGRGAVLSSPYAELLIGAALTGLAGMGVALLISALVRSSDRAATALPLILITQTVVSAPLLGPPPAVLREVGYASTAQWGFAAMAATIDLNDVRAPFIAVQDAVRAEANGVEYVPGRSDRPTWAHDGRQWTFDVAILLLLGAGSIVGAWWALRRMDPNLEARSRRDPLARGPARRA